MRPTGRQRRAAAAAAAACALALLAGCGGVHGFAFATPPDTTAAPTTSTTVPPDLTGDAQDRVAGGSPTSTVAIGPGQASLTGTVLGPSGPVGGATVEADRIVGGTAATLRVTTGPDGSWQMPGILGGRFRVRAWQTPTLAMATPQIFFLGATQSMPVSLQLAPYDTQSVSSAANPVTAPIGGAINVEVEVANESVDSDGFVRYRPAAGITVSLNAAGSVGVGANPLVTNGDGLAVFTLACLAGGGASGTVSTPTGTSSNLPSLSCYYAAPVTPSPSTTTPSSTTSTTTPGGAGGPSTTSTTTGLLP